jgi:NADPH:quinone reductase-like Zn-dependent oxidoreductase
MKAIVIHEHGGVDRLVYEDVDMPRPGFGEVLVKVKAAGINHFDLDIREGRSGLTHQMPHVMGLEAAGDVAEVGEGVTAVAPGDRVAPTFLISAGSCRNRVCNCDRGLDNLCWNGGILGVTEWGAYAEYVKVAQHNLIRLPDGLSYDDAAAAQVTMGTAHQMVVSQARIGPGEDVLVNAAGSGIGTAAIQIAKLAGARVIASAGSDEKLERARDLGADDTINYRRQNIAEEVSRLTGGRGADAVIESVGGEVFLQSLEALTPGGRLVTCGAHAGEKVEIDVIELFRKQVAIHGTDGAPKAQIARVFDLVAQRRLRPVIHQAFPFRDAAQAHKLMDERKIFGKLILHPEAP